MDAAQSVSLLLRVQEAESLLMAKQAALEAQIERKANLEQSLKQERERESALRQSLLEMQARLAAAKAGNIRAGASARQLEVVLEDGSHSAEVQLLRESCEQRLAALSGLVAQEEGQMRRFEAACGAEGGVVSDLESREARAAAMEGHLEQAQTRMPAIRKKLNVSGLEQKASALQTQLKGTRAQAAKAEAQLQGRQEALTSLRGQVEELRHQVELRQAHHQERELRAQVDGAVGERAHLENQRRAMESRLSELKLQLVRIRAQQSAGGPTMQPQHTASAAPPHHQPHQPPHGAGAAHLYPGQQSHGPPQYSPYGQQFAHHQLPQQHWQQQWQPHYHPQQPGAQGVPSPAIPDHPPVRNNGGHMHDDHHDASGSTW